jgi:hypothetical protein
LPAQGITRSPLSPRRDTARDAHREDVTTADDGSPDADASLPGSAAATRVASARAADAGDRTVASARAGRAEANIAVARGGVAGTEVGRRVSQFIHPVEKSARGADDEAHTFFETESSKLYEQRRARCTRHNT